jgi:hypothetical protein
MPYDQNATNLSRLFHRRVRHAGIAEAGGAEEAGIAMAAGRAVGGWVVATEG